MTAVPHPPSPGRVLLILAHPSKNSLNGALLQAYQTGLKNAGIEPQVLFLADLNFDPCLQVNQGEAQGTQELEPDLRAFQQELASASHVVWFFPSWWAGPPAKLKGLIDRTFLPGWAYRYEGRALPTPLLAGRSQRMVTTMDSPSLWYRFAHGRSIHRSMITATLSYVGFKNWGSITLFSVRTMRPTHFAKAFAKLERLGQKDGARLNPNRLLTSALA